MSISNISNGAPPATGSPLKTSRPADGVVRPESEAFARADADAGTPDQGVYVDLSPLARRMSAQDSGKLGAAGHADIDESGLPSVVKDLLKRIRELKEQLRDLQQQMRQIQSDASLSPEQRQAQLQQLMGQIQAVSAALSTANSALGKALKQQTLSPDQLSQVASFLAS